MPETIYISISACADPDLMQTVLSAYQNAADPGRIYFGIVNQIFSDEHRLQSDFLVDNDNINYVEVRSDAPLGTGVGRLWASSLANISHTYVFQIDSHMIFEKSWDEMLIHALKSAESLSGSDKVVITAFPADWVRVDGKFMLSVGSKDRVPVDINPFDFTLESLKDLIPEEHIGNDVPKVFVPSGYPNTRDHVEVLPRGYRPFLKAFSEELEFLKADGVSAHYMFSRWTLARELLHDSQNDWDGDQTNYSFRLIANDYQIYTPNRPVILHRLSSNNQDIESWRRYIQIHRGSVGKAAKEFQDKMFSGEYTGYWGAKSPEEAKEISARLGIW